MSHTQGEWLDCGCHYTTDDDGIHFCTMHAAAPDLLAACKGLMADIGYHCDEDGCECGEFEEFGKCCHTDGFAAISKATGGEK